MELTAGLGRSWNLRSMALFLGVTFLMAWALWLVAWLITQHELSLPLIPVIVEPRRARPSQGTCSYTGICFAIFGNQGIPTCCAPSYHSRSC
jgi:hypothetical protein